MNKFLGLIFIALIPSTFYAQEVSAPRTLTMEEYEKAKTLKVKDLDNDTYVKFDNTYVLDRYEARKPYFITGDDGQKKRIDIYRLILKEGMLELGTVVYYTNEKGKLYQACLPGFRANAKVWEKYFEDIHAIDKTEPNFVLKLSYVLSKELGFQLYKAANQGKDLSKESGTYGADICFPGDVQVAMFDGTKKALQEIKAGDRVITVDPVTQISTTTQVKELVQHEQKNYAITRLVLLGIDEKTTANGTEVKLLSKELNATPNHPVMTTSGEKKAGEVKEGDEILCLDKKSGMYERYIIWNRSEKAGGYQKVYNIVAESGSTFIMNEVMVLQKPLQ